MPLRRFSFAKQAAYLPVNFLNALNQPSARR
ncbi:hypothetical protein APA386B_2227 [Acetobacter pasteurianus 386B]|nr:hypothetical protein APA386B_2227 [Acetobacter pasteurianus 386B]